MKRRALTTLTMVLLGAAVLSGCASAGPGGGGGTGGTNETPDVPGELELDAAWLDGGRMIAVTTMGSSTCVPVAEEPKLDGEVLAVTLVDPTAQGAEVVGNGSAEFTRKLHADVAKWKKVIADIKLSIE